MVAKGCDSRHCRWESRTLSLLFLKQHGDGPGICQHYWIITVGKMCMDKVDNMMTMTIA